MGTDDVRWLDEGEERLWRAWVRLNLEMNAALQRGVQADGLSMPDFGVLVHLTDDPAGRSRVTDLARLMQWERSRVSHHVARMERRGLVRRVECPHDGRGAFVEVTEDGRAAIERAAPGHLRTVRRLLFDVLDADEQACLARTVDRLLSVLPAEEPAEVAS